MKSSRSIPGPSMLKVARDARNFALNSRFEWNKGAPVMSVSQAAPKPPLMVLVVDDEPGFRNLLDWELTGQGMTVETAPNGAEGVRSEEHTSELQSRQY